MEKTVTQKSSKLQERVLTQMPRILGLGDRDPASGTFGCFDRYYWHYKLLDIANARFQEVSLLLALLWKKDFPGNLYFGKRAVYEWMKGAVHFWGRMRNRDGSVNEVYPYERSFCATAFSTLAVSEALLTLGENRDLAFEKTGRWLVQNQNPAVANQMAASAVALYNLFLITEDDYYRKGAFEKISFLLSHQTKDGYFPEYGGYDMGYLFLTVGLLTRFFYKSRMAELEGALERSLRFLEERVESDGSFSLEGTSRQTQFIYPYGLMRRDGALLEAFYRGLLAETFLTPVALDDRYVIPLVTDYLEASFLEPIC